MAANSACSGLRSLRQDHERWPSKALLMIATVTKKDRANNRALSYETGVSMQKFGEIVR